MTLRERFEMVLRGGKPDFIPFYGDLTYWYSTHAAEGDLPLAWRGPRGIGRMHRDLRVGEYVPGCCAYVMQEGETVEVVSRETRLERVTEWRTPVGSLRQRCAYSEPSSSWGFTEHAVKVVEDLRVLRYIMAHRRYTPTPEAITRIDHDYGENGVPVVAVLGSPITELNKAWMGVMDMVYMLADAPEEVALTLEAMARSQDRMYEITEACACPYVMICENLSAETMGGYFDPYIRPYLTPRIAGLHAHGKKVLLHNDGTLRGTLEKLASIGVDCVDSVVPAPVGDVAVADLRALAGNEIILLGGLPGAMFAPPFTPEKMEAHVLEILRVHKDSGRFMLGVADQVPPNGDIEILRRVTELVEKHGRYE